MCKPLQNASFFRQVKEALDTGVQVKIRVQGKSMRPFLYGGDQVLLTAVHGTIRPGDIVLAHSMYGIVLHRVVHIRGNKIVLAGDANVRQTESIVWEDMIGVVTEASRGERKLPVFSGRARAAAFIWYLLRPFRGYLLRICDSIKRNKNINK